jgi:predicted MFS family arabinose efflux permease
MSNCATGLQQEESIAIPFFGRIAILCSNIIIFIGLFSLGPALPPIQARFSFDPHAFLETELVGSVAGFAFALTSLEIGKVVERFGYRPVLLGSLALFSIAGVIGTAFVSMPVIILSRVVVGFACALIVNASLVALGMLFPEAQRTRILGLQAVIGGVVGIGLYPLVGILGGIDWRLPFMLHLSALVLIPMVLTLPRGTGQKNHEIVAGKLGPLGSVLILAIILVGASMFIISAFGSLYLSKLGVRNAMLLSLPSTACAIGSMLGSSVYIVLHGRLGISGSFMTSLFAIAFGLALEATSTGVVLFTFGIFCAGVGVGMFAPNINAAAILAAPSNPSRTLGLANGLLYGSMIVFPLVATPLSIATGGLGHVILSFAVLTMASALAFVPRLRLRVNV